LIRHAGLVALRLAGRWRGALIEGDSGAGKSDLALRCLAEGFRLVADDRVVIWASGDGVYGRAPDSLAGRIEVRGLGVLPISALDMAEIVLQVRCVANPAHVERLPEPRSIPLLGKAIAAFQLSPLEASAPMKLRLALEYLGARP
jgi:serine kinase of HPr protein (carbohydrate metabolism regulator)